MCVYVCVYVYNVCMYAYINTVYVGTYVYVCVYIPRVSRGTANCSSLYCVKHCPFVICLNLAYFLQGCCGYHLFLRCCTSFCWSSVSASCVWSSSTPATSSTGSSSTPLLPFSPCSQVGPLYLLVQFALHVLTAANSVFISHSFIQEFHLLFCNDHE